jgi:hypothetical protein
MGTKTYNTATDLITFSRASSATFLGSNGLLQTAANNVPRIEYDAAGAVKGLLIEEARTNLRANSVDLSTSGFLANYAVITGSQPDPNGGSTGFVLSAMDASNKFRSMFVTGSIAAGNTITGSIWIKGVAGETTEIRVTRGGSGTFENTIKLITLTGGWQRESVTHTFTNSQEYSRFDAGRVTSTATAQSISLAWCQVEAGDFPTSYIPTTGATATRAADLASIPTSAFGYNAEGGTVVCDFNMSFGGATFPRAWELGSTLNGNDRIVNSVASSSGSLSASLTTASVQEAFKTTSSGNTTPLGPVKTAFAWRENDVAAVQDGGTVLTDGTATITGGNPRTVLALGKAAPASANHLNGHIKSIQYYPRRLTNAQLQELTT